MRNVIDFLFNIERCAERKLADTITVKSMTGVSFARKLAHPKTRRHLAAMSIGAALCLTGSFMAAHPIECFYRFVWDAMSYSVHGIGLVPFCAHTEPLWAILMED